MLRPLSAQIVSTKLSQPTKKVDCSVSFQVKKIYRFPKFAIIKDTKHLRDVNSKALKQVLGKLKLDKKTLFDKKFWSLGICVYDPPGYDLILQSYVYNFQASILKCTPLSSVVGKLKFSL